MGESPPPERCRCGTLEVGVSLGFPLETLAESPSGGDEEESIHVICNANDGSYVGWLHGRGHVLRRLKVPMWVERARIANQMARHIVARVARS